MHQSTGLVLLACFLVGCGSARSENGAVSGPAPVAAAAPAKSVPPRTIERPIPYSITPPADFQQALAKGTRSTTGAPGPRYWQQWADYELTARLDAAAKRLDGTGRVVYHNYSPDTLRALFMHLHQNLHAPGVIRNRPVEVTGGVVLERLALNGVTLDSLAPEGALDSIAVGYAIAGTRLLLRPPEPLLPGDSAVIESAWHFTVPQSGAGRMGWSDDNLFFIAYWYPQMAVYDDVVGWQTDPYQGNGEFYAGFGSYDVTIDAPEGWVVMSTGALQNPADVLPSDVIERLRRAEQSDSVITVLAAGQFGAGRATRDAPDDRLIWRFHADTVRDVAFSATRESRWDAVRTEVGDRDGDGSVEYARIDAFYRETAPLWSEAARYGAHAIDFLSRYTGVSYPWPHMSLVEGAEIIGSGMEFPMFTLIGDYTARGDTALYNVVAHELAHMWVPMIVSSDEKRYAWMDEGTTTFHENQARKEFFPGSNAEQPDRQTYIRVARTGNEGEMMRWTEYHYPGRSGIASYMKPATVLAALREVLGDSLFLRAHRTYLDRWAFKHPKPWDFFNTFEDVTGRDLDWFWRSWYYETWTLDQAVADVNTTGNGTTITIEDRGYATMPVHLVITHADGSTGRREVPVDVWLNGARSTQVTVADESPVTRVEIDPEQAFPDVERGNNVWVSGGTGERRNEGTREVGSR